MQLEETKDLATELVNQKIEEVSDYRVGTKESITGTNEIVKLVESLERLSEIERKERETDAKIADLEERRFNDTVNQNLANDRQEKSLFIEKLKLGVTAASAILIPLVMVIIDIKQEDKTTDKILKYEETGVLTSSVGRKKLMNYKKHTKH